MPFIGFPIASQNATKKEQKIQNPDQKASKRVCPTHVSAQQLCPQSLFLNSLTIHFDEKIGLFAQFFPVIKAAVFYMEFWFMTGLPQESRLFLFLQIHQHSEQNVKLEITQKLCKVWLINVLFPKNLEQQKMDGKNFARVLFPCRYAGRVHLPRKKHVKKN